MKYYLLIFFLGLSTWGKSQLTKDKVVRILSFQEGEDISVQDIFNDIPKYLKTRPIGKGKILQDIIARSINKDARFFIQRFGLVDWINKEKELQKHEFFIDGKTVKRKKIQKADFLFSGTWNDKGHQLELGIYDTASRKLIYQCSIHIKSKKIEPNSKPLQVELEEHTRLFLKSAFPQSSKIVEIVEGTKKAKVVLITYGRSQNAKKGIKLSALVGNEKIGSLKILEVQGNDLALAKVTKGGLEIRNALLSGNDIYVRIEK